MKGIKHLPKKYCRLMNALAVAVLVMAVLSALADRLAVYLAFAALLVLFVVLRFVLFRCPHCGKLLNVLPSKEIVDGERSTYCVRCGGEISFQ